MIETTNTPNPHDSNDPKKQEIRRESLTTIARELGVYAGPDLSTLPHVPAARLETLLRAILPNAETFLSEWRLECVAEKLPYEVEELVELVRFQQDYESSGPSPIWPEGYRYRGGNSQVVMYVVDRRSGQESYQGSLCFFGALPTSLTSRIASAWHDDVGTMHTYLILDAYLPVSESEFGDSITSAR